MTIALVFGEKSKDIRARMLQLRDDLQIDIYRTVEDLIRGSETRNKVYDRIILISKVFAPPVDAGQALNDLYNYWRSFCASSEFILFARKGREDELAETFTRKMCSPICTAVLVQNATTVIIEALATYEITELANKYGCQQDLSIEIETDSYAEPEPEPKPEPVVAPVAQQKKSGFFGKFFNKKNKKATQETPQVTEAEQPMEQDNTEYTQEQEGYVQDEYAQDEYAGDEEYSEQYEEQEYYKEQSEGYEQEVEYEEEPALSTGNNAEFSEAGIPTDFSDDEEQEYSNEYDEFQNEEVPADFEENNEDYQTEENYEMQDDEQVDMNSVSEGENDNEDALEPIDNIPEGDEGFNYDFTDDEEISEVNTPVSSSDVVDDFEDDFVTDFSDNDSLNDDNDTPFTDVNMSDETVCEDTNEITEENSLDEFSDVSMQDYNNSLTEQTNPEVEPEQPVEECNEGVSMRYTSGLEPDTPAVAVSSTTEFINLGAAETNEGVVSEVTEVTSEEDFVQDISAENQSENVIEDNSIIFEMPESESAPIQEVEDFSVEEPVATEEVSSQNSVVPDFDMPAVTVSEVEEADAPLPPDSLSYEQSESVIPDVDSTIEEPVEGKKKKGFSLGGLFGKGKKEKVVAPNNSAEASEVPTESSLPRRARPQTVAIDTESGLPKKGFAPRQRSRVNNEVSTEVQAPIEEVVSEPVVSEPVVATPVEPVNDVKPKGVSNAGMHRTVTTEKSVYHPQVSKVQSDSEVTVVDDDDLFGDLDIAELDSAYKEDEAASNVRIERVEIVKEVVKEIPSSGKSKKVLNSLLSGKGHRVFLVTGDRGVGTTTFAYELATELSKHISVLYYDGDTEKHGLLNYISFERFCEYDTVKLQGSKLAKSTKAFNNCVIRYADNLDLLSSNFGVEASDDDYEAVQSVVADISNDYNVVVADIPFSKLHLCQELISASTTIVVAEKTKRGLMNLACCFDECKLPVRYKRKISSTGVLMLSRGDAKVDVKKLKRYVSDIVDFDEEDSNWLNMRTMLRDKMSSKFLQELID